MQMWRVQALSHIAYRSADVSLFRRRVCLLEWHPTAADILASAGYDHLVMVWDVSRWAADQSEHRNWSRDHVLTCYWLCRDPGTVVTVVQCHTDTIYSMSFNR